MLNVNCDVAASAFPETTKISFKPVNCEPSPKYVFADKLPSTKVLVSTSSSLPLIDVESVEFPKEIELLEKSQSKAKLPSTYTCLDFMLPVPPVTITSPTTSKSLDTFTLSLADKFISPLFALNDKFPF